MKTFVKINEPAGLYQRRSELAWEAAHVNSHAWKHLLKQKTAGFNHDVRFFVIIEPNHINRQDKVERRVSCFVTIERTDDERTDTILRALIQRFADFQAKHCTGLVSGSYKGTPYELTDIYETDPDTWYSVAACSFLNGAPRELLHIAFSCSDGLTPPPDSYFGQLAIYQPSTKTVIPQNVIGGSGLIDWLGSDALWDTITNDRIQDDRIQEYEDKREKGILQETFQPGDRFIHTVKDGSVKAGTVVNHTKKNPRQILVQYDDGKKAYVRDDLSHRIKKIQQNPK